MPFLWHCSTNGKLRILVKAQPAPQAPGHCHQLGLAYGRETWLYPTNTLSATVAFPRGPPRRVSAYEISKSTGFHVDFGFQIGFLDFTWISGFQSGFLDFKVDFWISRGFLDFKVDFWISRGFPDFKVDF